MTKTSFLKLFLEFLKYCGGIAFTLPIFLGLAWVMALTLPKGSTPLNYLHCAVGYVVVLLVIGALGALHIFIDERNSAVDRHASSQRLAQHRAEVNLDAPPVADWGGASAWEGARLLTVLSEEARLAFISDRAERQDVDFLCASMEAGILDVAPWLVRESDATKEFIADGWARRCEALLDVRVTPPAEEHDGLPVLAVSPEFSDCLDLVCRRIHAEALVWKGAVEQHLPRVEDVIARCIVVAALLERLDLVEVLAATSAAEDRDVVLKGMSAPLSAESMAFFWPNDLLLTALFPEGAAFVHATLDQEPATTMPPRI